MKIKVRNRESIDSIIKRFKFKLNKSNILNKLKEKKRHIKNSLKKKLKKIKRIKSLQYYFKKNYLIKSIP